MAQEKQITNEKLKHLYENPFDLVNHAIKVAHHMVASGQLLSNNLDKNSATVVLKKVVKDKELDDCSLELVEQTEESIEE